MNVNGTELRVLVYAIWKYQSLVGAGVTLSHSLEALLYATLSIFWQHHLACFVKILWQPPEQDCHENASCGQMKLM